MARVRLLLTSKLKMSIRMKMVFWNTVVGFLLLAVPARAEDLLIRAAKVYTMTGAPLTPGAVLVSKGKIVQVGAKLDAPAGAKVIDLGAGVLMPGLIDAHSNAGITGSLAEMTREITPDYCVLAAVDWRARVFRELLDEGTTCLGLCPGTMQWSRVWHAPQNGWPSASRQEGHGIGHYHGIGSGLR